MTRGRRLALGVGIGLGLGLGLAAGGATVAATWSRVQVAYAQQVAAANGTPIPGASAVFVRDHVDPTLCVMVLTWQGQLTAVKVNTVSCEVDGTAQ